MAEGETVFTFKANTKPAEEQTDSFFDSLQGKFTEINSGLELINKAVTAIAKASQAVVDFAKAGEEIQAIGTRFELIAKQAGLIPENIASGIENAVAGTVDMEDALKAASGAIVSLEAGANRLPEIFNLAKKATALFGGDVVERFEQINMAIASGSTRALRAIGIILDTDKVYKDYANSLDITADKLTLAERQQALMNAVLDKGATAFKNINSSITPISENLKKTDVAIKELGDTGATVFNQLFGATISNSLSKFALSLQALNIQLGEALLGKVPTAAENLKLLNNQLFELESRRDMAAARGNIGQLEQIFAEIEATKQKILINESLVNQEATKQAIMNATATATHNAADATDRMTESTKKLAEELRGKFMAAAKASIEAEKEMDQQARILGTTFKNALVNVISRGIDHIAQKLIKGEDIFGGFLAAVLMTFGEMAQQIGTTLIGIGIGIESLKMLSGFAAIAAGIGLVLIGGIMKALAGGGGGGGPVANPNEAAADAVIASGDVYQQTQEEERAAAQTGVQVVVQGNIFDSRETGLQIAQIINDSFDLNGTIIRANA
jgi:hypothetical protein